MLTMPFNRILFDYLKACHQIPPEAKVKQMLTLPTSDIPSYELPGLNVKIRDKSLSSHILHKGSRSIYGELEHILTYMLKRQEIGLYQMKKNFNGHKETSLPT